MQIPADQIFGSPSFHFISQKQEDGTFQVTIANRPEVPPGKGPSEQIAMTRAAQNAEAWLGKTGGGGSRVSA